MARGGYMSGIFGSSPVSPMQQHMAKVHACVSELVPLFNALVNDDEVLVQETQKKISKLENEADVLKKELRMNLPKGLFMPVSRQDLLEVLTMQDKIANAAKDVAGLIVGRKMKLPDIIQDDFIKYIQRCVDACAQAQVAINQLDELVETGFSGNELKIVLDMIAELDVIESDSDKIQAALKSELFSIENEVPPVEMMFLYKLVELTGDVADEAQHVGHRLQILLAR